MIVNEFLKAFRDEYGHLDQFGLIITGIYVDAELSDNESLQVGISKSLEPFDVIIPEHCHMSVMHPFLFDNRKIPESFMGVSV